MAFEFYKYQGTGNDFIILDDRSNLFPSEDTQKIARWCDRRFGIGADGLILLRNKEGYDFEMVYYNSDGRQSSMCGNGGRCIAAFAHTLNLGEGSELNFLAVDGPHLANVRDNAVSLQMKDVNKISPRASAWVLDTGSPHFVLFQQNIDELNMVKLARAIRYNAEFSAGGINVNFVEEMGNGQIKVRTYERGVEDETYSCGTGVVASVLASWHQHHQSGPQEGSYSLRVMTKGGELSVNFIQQEDGRFTNIWLNGPATKVFKGEID